MGVVKKKRIFNLKIIFALLINNQLYCYLIF